MRRSANWPPIIPERRSALAFMDLGMPQSQQILYKVLVVPVPPGPNEPCRQENRTTTSRLRHRSEDVNLKLAEDGIHAGGLNISLIVYDRYGNIIGREDHLVALNIKPDLHDLPEHGRATSRRDRRAERQLLAPYWSFRPRSRKVGTMEVPLSAVKAAPASAGQ